jgi:hypothetical protein
VNHGFNMSQYDCCVYFREYEEGSFVYLLLYVDDMLVACRDKSIINNTKQLLMQEFYMKELGQAKKILGMEINRDRRVGLIKLSQASYLNIVLNSFYMSQSKSVSTPMGQQFKLSSRDSPKSAIEVRETEHVPYSNAVGSLMYIMVCTRPDIGYAVSLVSRFISNPGRNYWESLKWILWYHNGTREIGGLYGKD